LFRRSAVCRLHACSLEWSSRSWRPWSALGSLLLALRLLWLELGVEERATISFNKVVALCHHLMWGGDAGILPLAGHGSEERKGADVSSSAEGCWRGRLLLRLGEEISGSSSLAALHRWLPAIQLLSLMAVGQPLPPWSPASWREVYNLQAFVPDWRPSGADAVRSRRSTPSGHVPGGGALDCDRLLRQGFGGEGASGRPGLDCFSNICARVCSAIFKGHVVIFSGFEVLRVKFSPPTII
jgi:hypothetical protein